MRRVSNAIVLATRQTSSLSFDELVRVNMSEVWGAMAYARSSPPQYFIVHVSRSLRMTLSHNIKGKD
jgi:hypothetical protein